MTSLTPGAADNRWRQGLRSRRRVLMVVSLLTAWCLLVGDGLAQEPPRPTIPPPPPPTSLSDFDVFNLWNECAPMRLSVEELPDDAADIDLTEERIQTLAESRLRAARLYDAAALPYLYVNVGVTVSENRRGGAFLVDVSFNKYLRDGAVGSERVRGDVEHRELRNVQRGCRLQATTRTAPPRLDRLPHLRFAADPTTICPGLSSER